YDGKEVIIDSMMPGDPIGVVALLNHFPFPATCQMAEDSQVAKIPEPIFKNFLSLNPLFHQTLMQMMAKRLRHSHEMMRSLSNDPVEQRLSKVILKQLKEGKNTL